MFDKVLIFALLGVSLVLAQPVSERAQGFDTTIEELSGISKEKYAELKEQYNEYKEKAEDALQMKMFMYNDQLAEIVGTIGYGASLKNIEAREAQVRKAMKEEQAKFEANLSEFSRKMQNVVVEIRYKYFHDRSFEEIVQDLKEKLGNYAEMGWETLDYYERTFNHLQQEAKALTYIEKLQPNEMFGEKKAKLVENFDAVFQDIKDELTVV